MLRPTVIKVKSEDNYFLRIEFDNGEIKKLDGNLIFKDPGMED